MKTSWKIGTFAGIGVYIHATFLLIIGWVAFSYWQQTRALSGTLEGIFFTLALFGCVVLHEYGHALTARRYGIKTRDITLYPIGGVARLERMPDQPIQELWVAFAGPAVNIAIAIILYIWLTVTGLLVPLSSISLTGGPFVERLMLVNISLVLFNLIPAFPMDGGRVLRALMALRLEYSRATQIAASVGQGLALVFGLIGLFTNPFLVLIALFIWFGAGQEASVVRMKAMLGGVPAEQAMLTDFQVLSPRNSLAYAVSLLLNGSQTEYPVVEDQQVIGMVSRSDILTALPIYGRETPVSSIMKREFQTVDVNEMLDAAFTRMQEHSSDTMPVLQRGQIVGLLTSENISKYVMIQSALKANDPPSKRLVWRV